MIVQPKPLNGRVFIVPMPRKKKTDGGIAIPDAVNISMQDNIGFVYDYDRDDDHPLNIFLEKMEKEKKIPGLIVIYNKHAAIRLEGTKVSMSIKGKEKKGDLIVVTKDGILGCLQIEEDSRIIRK